jgi:inosine-uridine nucleoside N-ribohydrolase
MILPLPAVRRVVLDTDTYNEVDDQFALAHLLLSPETISLEAVYAAPFYNQRAANPGDGMEKSYDEILRVLALVGAKPAPKVFKGSRTYLPDAKTPVQSEAARDLVERALATTEGKLYVAAIAAITNIASALLIEPKIAEKIVVIWLGGNASYWPHNQEFNLAQDAHAARVVHQSTVPFVHIPCMPVASHLITSPGELEQQLEPYSKLGAYLSKIVREYEANAPGWSKQIWDISASAWLVNPDWLVVDEKPCPTLNEDLTWDNRPNARRILEVRQLDRDKIFADFFAKAKRLG